jgi:3',5'-cyclic AMP phosphodiesterase CpdA
MKASVPDVQQLVAALPANTLIHGIAVGDICWDDLKLFADYNEAVRLMGIPFFQCIGNHDLDFRKGGDETSDDTFTELYGPTCYSFNRGQVHYVVMDDVRYLGTERDYDGYFHDYQLNWLKKDLSFVPKDKLIVFCVHIPVTHVKNKEALYDVLEGRTVHIMSGHTHYHVNSKERGFYEHNHGTVCGAWWTGNICCDGTPNGYGVYTAKGNELSWYYKSTGKPLDHQMRLYVQDFSESQKQLIANIWNWDEAWKSEYFIDGISKGALLQTEDYDPRAYETLMGPEKPKSRGFAEPHKTNHLFTAMIPTGAKEVKVVATDPFGRVFQATKKVGEPAAVAQG